MSARPAAPVRTILVVAVLAAGCSEGDAVAGWCGRAERVFELETGGRGRVVSEAVAAGELAVAYGALAVEVPTPLDDDVAVMADFTAAIAAELDAGASSLDVIEGTTRDVDVGAVEAAHARILDAIDDECDVR